MPNHTMAMNNRRFGAAILFAMIFFANHAFAQWPNRMQVGPFHLHGDFDLRPLKPLFDEIVELRLELQRKFHFAPSSETIDVYLFARRDNYLQYMRYYFPGVGVREAMFVKSNSPGNVFAYAGRNLQVDLRHECTHAILHSMLPMVPLWLDEGLAEYYELPASERAFDNRYISAVRRNSMMRLVPSVVELEAIGELSEMGTKQYRDAWAWVHFMLHGPEQAQVALLEFLNQVENHRPPTPISESLRQKFANPSREFAKHFSKWKR